MTNEEIEAKWTERERAIAEIALVFPRTAEEGRPRLLTDAIAMVLEAADHGAPRPTHRKRPDQPLEERRQLPIADVDGPVPSVPMTQAEERDETLVALAASRAVLIARATEIALELDATVGHVTGRAVLEKMRQTAELAEMMRCVDPRFMGGVLLPSKGWRKLEYVAEGHHARPVPRWTRRPA